MATNFKPCSIDGCNRNAHWTAKGAKGWCGAHYWRWRKNGAPMAGRTAVGSALKWIQEVALSHDSDQCLIWPFGRSSRGYGQAHVDGRNEMAHRVVCEEAHGPAPSPEHEAAHSCGKGEDACVSPIHLRWATPSENQMDRVEHGTSNRGERHGLTYLTEPQVLSIKRMSKTMTPVEIQAETGIDRRRVSAIAKGSTWGWLE